MKKFLSILLALAMVVSVVSVVAFAADDCKEVLNVTFEDENAAGYANNAWCGNTNNQISVDYVTDGSHGKVMKFGTNMGWESPQWNIIDDVKDFAAKNPGKDIVLLVSADAKVGDAVGDNDCSVRFSFLDDKGGRILPKDSEDNELKGTRTGEWMSFEGKATIAAADVAAVTAKQEFKFGPDKIMNNKASAQNRAFVYLDNLKITLCVPGAEPTPTPAENPTPTPAEEGEATPTPTATPVPKVVTGVKFTFNEAITEGQQFIRSAEGVVSAADVKNNAVTKKFSITNNGTEAIGIVFRMQALVKNAEGNDTWAGEPASNEMVVIEPGKTETVEFTCDVEGSKITILDQDVDVSKLFYRFDVTDSEGGRVIPAGTSLTVNCNEATAKAFTDDPTVTVNYKKITMEHVYGSNSNSSNNGDVLPVAFITVAVAAAVALVVICAKKKEEI